MSQDVITVGLTMRIPLLYRGEYSQWRERFMNYLEEQTDGEAIINSIQNGDQPLLVIAQVSLVGTAQNAPPTLKDLKFWTAEEKKTQTIDYNCELNYKFLNNLQLKWKQYGTLMRQTKNLMDINIDALYNILKQNQGHVNDALGYKKKAGSGADDFSELKKITALLAKAFKQRKFYSKPTNNNLRTSSTSQSANKKQEFVKSNDKKEDKKADEKKMDMSKVKCFNCKKEGHFSKDCKKAKEINANMVFMVQIEKVLSKSDERSSSVEETIAEAAYYTSESESESEFETFEYYDNSTNYGLFVNNDDDQEIFHDAIESAIDKLIQKFNHKIAKCHKRIEKANQQSKDFKNQNKDLQEKYDVLINHVNTFEEKNNEFNEQIKVLNKKNDDLLAQTKVLKDQLQVKHVVINTHVECHEKYAKLEEERYEYMIRYSALFDNDKQHRKQIADQEVLFDKMSVQLVELDKHVRDLKNIILEKDFKILELKECVCNKDLEIEKSLEHLNVCENKIHKMGQTNQTVHMIMPFKDILYNGQNEIGFENPRYFEKAKDLRPSLYDEKVIGLGLKCLIVRGIFVRDKMSQDVITVGSTMRIPLLYRGEYSQWREMFMNYLEEQTDGEAMINSIQNGDQPLLVIAQVSLAGTAQNAPPTLKDLKFWTAEEKKTQTIDCLARSLFIQGLPNDIYSLIDSNETAKDLWDALERQMRGSEYGEQDRKAAIFGADDFSELKKITALLAKAFKRRKFYSKPTNNNLRTSSTSQSANKKQEFVKSNNKKEDKKADEKKMDMSKVKCFNCNKEGHFSKDCKKAKEINANMVFMAQIEKVLSKSNESSSSVEETVAEAAYYTSESKSESEFETFEYYDNSTNYGLFVNNDDDQEIFHDAIESASENFFENHIDSQKDYDKSEVDHNDSEEKTFS
uniref:CCHC-type domain-containing protein n=1 Tax=Tanacetum cinerariifolium TaxID=118510 RepID=A0A699HLX6_TANCI|nr:hypothetical protein [Tanacetum cinerariifolium]